jgi:hypothetical protein
MARLAPRALLPRSESTGSARLADQPVQTLTAEAGEHWQEVSAIPDFPAAVCPDSGSGTDVENPVPNPAAPNLAVQGSPDIAPETLAAIPGSRVESQAAAPGNQAAVRNQVESPGSQVESRAAVPGSQVGNRAETQAEIPAAVPGSQVGNQAAVLESPRADRSREGPGSRTGPCLVAPAPATPARLASRSRWLFSPHSSRWVSLEILQILSSTVSYRQRSGKVWESALFAPIRFAHAAFESPAERTGFS